MLTMMSDDGDVHGKADGSADPSSAFGALNSLWALVQHTYKSWSGCLDMRRYFESGGSEPSTHAGHAKGKLRIRGEPNNALE